MLAYRSFRGPVKSVPGLRGYENRAKKKSYVYLKLVKNFLQNNPCHLPAQYPAFDSLHWFQSVSEHHAEERARVEERARGAGADDKLRQTSKV